MRAACGLVLTVAGASATWRAATRWYWTDETQADAWQSIGIVAAAVVMVETGAALLWF
jgi:hypothetical protein